uniref:Uncharacterized protein n=1 Tax=viral metagenome TaxID=1070528 RepID=A0A6C0JER2_9ZZZZ
MKEFLDKYASLSNKNSPITIHYGIKISENIFNTKIDKQRLDSILEKIKKIENMKLNISYINDITEYKTENTSIIKSNNELDYLIYNIKDSIVTNNLYIIKHNIQINSTIIPSISQFESIEKYDLMNISFNNFFNIKIHDYKEYYTLTIQIKKPNSGTFLHNILSKIFT